MLSRKFPELWHSMQELDATDLNLAILRRGVRFIFPVLVAHAFIYQVRRLFHSILDLLQKHLFEQTLTHPMTLFYHIVG